MPPRSSGSADPADAARRHLEGIAKNLEFAAYLRGSGRADPTTVGWAITALFYTALHAVRAYLAAHHGRVVTAHQDMHTLLKTHPELRRTQTPYDLLKQESEAARYYCADFVWENYDSLMTDSRRVVSTWKPLAERALSAPR